MPTIANTPFIDALQQSQLIEQDQLERLLAHFPGIQENSKELADYLAQQKAITPFQAKFLLTGRHKGLTIGPYVILDKIGAGGMGVVYLAEHRKLGRKVALKVLQEDRISDQLTLERFYREARSVATLDHPNIVKAHDVGDDNGVHYLVMEYINGVNLQKYLQKKGCLPWKTVNNIILQVCRGLQHAYERNFIHRDIKPANLLIDKNGQIKILDLGLARSLEKQRDNLTADLSDGKDVQGSIDYVSPEQAFGQTVVDIRGDIYSLGATAYVLLTGEPIVSGSPAQKLLQHQMNLPTPPHYLQPSVPKALSDVIMKMLAKQPAQRFATPAAVIAALKPLQSPTAGTMVQPVIQDMPSLPPAVEPAVVAHDATTTVLKNEVTRKVRKSPGKKLKKKKANNHLVRWGLLAGALLLCVGLIWGSISMLSSPTVKKPVELAVRNIPAAAEASKGAGATKDVGKSKTPDNYKNPEYSKDKDAPPPNAFKLTIGLKLPEIYGEDLDRKRFRLSDFTGRVVLLDFWGFWCPHCVTAFPRGKEWVKKYQKRPFTLIGVNNDSDDNVIEQGLKKHQLPWRSFRDKLPDGRKISDWFGITGFPTLVLLDDEGVIKKVWVGTPPDYELHAFVDSQLKAAENRSK